MKDVYVRRICATARGEIVVLTGEPTLVAVLSADGDELSVSALHRAPAAFYSLDVDAHGNPVAAAKDGVYRLEHEAWTRIAPLDGQPYALSVSPDGSIVVAGAPGLLRRIGDDGRVEVLDVDVGLDFGANGLYAVTVHAGEIVAFGQSGVIVHVGADAKPRVQRVPSNESFLSCAASGSHLAYGGGGGDARKAALFVDGQRIALPDALGRCDVLGWLGDRLFVVLTRDGDADYSFGAFERGIYVEFGKDYSRGVIALPNGAIWCASYHGLARIEDDTLSRAVPLADLFSKITPTKFPKRKPRGSVKRA